MASRGFNPWVQPKYPTLNVQLKISFEDILRISKSVPGPQINSWDDVSQIDIRPKNGSIRVRTKIDQWEIFLNGETGEVVNVGKRRNSLLSSIHEGAYFGPIVRYGIFFPTALGLVFLLLSGAFLLIKTYTHLWRKN